MNQQAPRIYGYLRVSTPEQKQSHDRVRAQAMERIADLKEQGAELGFIIEEEESAVDLRYTERPAFATIMKVINPGDHLIVESKDRLDRDPVAMLNCLEWLKRRKVVLHCLGVSDRPLNLDDYQTQMMNYIDGMSSFHFIHWLKLKTHDALQYRKQNGYAYGKSLPPGRGKVVLPTKSHGGKNYKAMVWDEAQCAIIRDIKRMHETGMSFVAIGRLLNDRGLRTATGGKWAHKRKGKKDNGNKGWVASPVRRVYTWYCKLLASGKDVGDVPLLQPAVPYVPPAPKPKKPPPKPREPWQPKPWQYALLSKWAEAKGATASRAETSSPSSSSESSCPSSSAASPSPEQSPFFSGRSGPPSPSPSRIAS